MSREELEIWIGREAVWRPVLRSADGLLNIPVTIEAVLQRYGRDEVRIHPKHGTGAAWVSAANVRLNKTDAKAKLAGLRARKGELRRKLVESVT